MVSAARPPIELVLDVPGVQTYPRDSVLALGGRSTSSSTRQPESSVSAARPPIELVLDVPGVQTYPRDSVLALGGVGPRPAHAAGGELSVCCEAAHRAGARRSRGPDVPERLGACPGGRSTSSSTRQPESNAPAARPPIELVLDVPGGQTYPRDSVLALGGMSTSSSTLSLSGAQHLRRGQVVAAATAPFLAFGDLQPGDRKSVV